MLDGKTLPRIPSAGRDAGEDMEPTDWPPRPPAPAPRLGARATRGSLGFAGFGVAVAIAGIATAAVISLPRTPATVQPIPARTAAVELAELEASVQRWTGDPRTWTVELTWIVSGNEVDHYTMTRNGKKLDQQVEGTSFVDSDVVPKAVYHYEVVAVDPDGNASRPGTATVRTSALDKADARMEGRWVLTLKILSSTIGAGGGIIVVTFDPRCNRGPCDVRWAFARTENEGTAARRGRSYMGVGRGSFLTRDCHGDPVSSTVTVDFRITKALTIGRAWRATKIAGTVDEDVPAVSNCLSAHTRWTFTGEVQS